MFPRHCTRKGGEPVFLQRLKEYAELHPPDLPSMYQMTPIRWLIDLDADGHFLGFVGTEGGGKKDRGKQLSSPYIKRASGVRPKLLADTGVYVLGIPREKDQPERVVECHQAFVAEVKTCAEATAEPSVRAVLRFLENLVAPVTLPEGFTPEDHLTFRIGETLPIDLPAVRSYWVSRATAQENGDEQTMECIVCGQVRPALSRLPIAIKGIRGGQTSGMALISANANAYESYGLKASLIAPICHSCAEDTHKSLNELLASRQTCLHVGPVTYVAWTREPTETNFLTLISSPEPDYVTALLHSVFGGGVAANPAAVDEGKFHAAALTPSGSRVVVRDWIDTTLATAKLRLARYFEGQRLVSSGGEIGRPSGLFALAMSTVPKNSKQEPHPHLVSEILGVALGGRRLSPWVLAQAVQRNRAERGVTHPRASLIKLVFSTQPDSGWQEGSLVSLDVQNQDPAYLCGRLLAVLEATQEAAVPGLNATLVDRFYGTASSAPGVVFPSLVRHAQPHLAKIRKTKGGLCTVLQTELQAILGGLGHFPHTLSLQAQGVFALGYYHQRAQRYKRKSASGTEPDDVAESIETENTEEEQNHV